MLKLRDLTVVASIALTLGACSSSKKNTDSPSADDAANPPAADANTDAVPQQSAEQPAADPAAAPPPPATDAAASAPPPATDAAAASTPSVDTTASNAGATPADTGGATDSYTMQSGDTLMKVAFETYGDLYKWKSILEANKDKIQDPSHIPAGTVLKLEKPATPVTIEKNGEQYVIKAGDTLGKISANVYGTQSKWKQIWENNKQMIKDPNKIFAGFTIYYVKDPNVAPNQISGNAPAGDGTRAPASNGGAPADGANGGAMPPPANPGQ